MYVIFENFFQKFFFYLCGTECAVEIQKDNRRVASANQFQHVLAVSNRKMTLDVGPGSNGRGGGGGWKRRGTNQQRGKETRCKVPEQNIRADLVAKEVGMATVQTDFVVGAKTTAVHPEPTMRTLQKLVETFLLADAAHPILSVEKTSRGTTDHSKKKKTTVRHKTKRISLGWTKRIGLGSK